MFVYNSHRCFGNNDDIFHISGGGCGGGGGGGGVGGVGGVGGGGTSDGGGGGKGGMKLPMRDWIVQ